MASPALSPAVETLRWEGDAAGHVRMVEQTLLPRTSTVIDVRTVDEMVAAIRRLAVRGAPAIGVAAAYGVLLGLREDASLERVRAVADTLAASRPTAVNLFWALRRMTARAEREAAAGADADALRAALLEEAHAVAAEDKGQCARMGALGAELIEDGATVLTHCNAGALATAGIGTALAPVYAAVDAGKRVRVFADETRPLLQGSRLTAWELMQAGIDVTLITDGMAGRVLYEGKVDAVFVGSDRIARNGDVCNKIGTYTVAVLARRHGVPFYVVAPLSTFDPDVATGDDIPIEERAPEEITEPFGTRTAPEGVGVYNPAFDVTPAELVTAIVTEVGVIEAPDTAKVEDALRRGGRL